MKAAAVIAAALGGVQYGPRWMARCPAHDDQTPSLSISEGSDGIVLVKCFTGCGPGPGDRGLALAWGCGIEATVKDPFTRYPPFPKTAEVNATLSGAMQQRPSGNQPNLHEGLWLRPTSSKS